MKKMRIVCECQMSGRRPSKTISFPITDEMCDHFKSLFTARNEAMSNGEVNTDDTIGFVSEGNRSIKVYMSVVDADMNF